MRYRHTVKISNFKSKIEIAGILWLKLELCQFLRQILFWFDIFYNDTSHQNTYINTV